MKIEHEVEGRRFVTRLGGDEAFVSYAKPGEKTLNLIHTEVPESFEGKGVASALARYAFDYARENGFKVIPSCAFIRKWIQKHHEYDDLIVA